MNPFKFLWKNMSTRIWLIVTCCVLVFALTVSLVITQVRLISGSLDMWLGGDRANVVGNAGIYEADYENKAAVYEAARKFNEKLSEEGSVLLKNEGEALPLKDGAKVTVFGKNSVNLVYGGSGSGGGKAGTSIDLYEGLKSGGLECNPTMKSFYESSASGSGRPKNPAIGSVIAGFATGETPVSSYTQAVRSSYSGYSDAALVVISRIGGEGFDLPRTMKTSYGADASVIDGAFSADSHYLELDKNETDMLKEACDNFDKVIVLMNCATSFELGFLTDSSHPSYSEKIKAALWIGNSGSTGTVGVGRVLTGKVNPSGRLVDTYARDFTKTPSQKNFGNNDSDNGHRYTRGDRNTSYYFVDYEEGIYVGYRYYETRGFTDGETWYNENVVFPFGFGKSYTNFKWAVTDVAPARGSVVTPDTEIKVTVRVTNDGSRAGKDVVQLYYTAPYTDGGIEKSHKVLGAFAKTDEIEPGGTFDAVLTLKVSDMKSYDYNDANKNGFKGYELEKGDYVLHVSHSAHEVEESLTFNVASDCRIDDTGESKVENRFDDVSEGVKSVMSRADFDGTFPTTPTTEDRTVTADFVSSLKYVEDDAGKPWYTDKTPTQASSTISEPEVTLKDLIGKDYDDPLWETLLSELTLSEMANLVSVGAYGTVALDNIGKNKTYEPDGPSGFTNFMTDGPIYDTCFYASECVVGSTWNKALAREMGVMVGNEGLIGCEREGLPYSGWYAPAVNIHRSPFSGRNWEYYSEDAYLSGALAVEVILGANSKGVYTFVKHFAVNDQETDRDSNGTLVWVDEQTMREIYLKPFEMAVKEGKTTAMMSSFNRLGKTWAGGSYALLTQVLRNEWGFKGMVITDYSLKDYMDENQMIRAGGDLVLNQGGKMVYTTNASATQVSAIRQAAKNILYTTANSCAMNADVDGYSLAIWKIVLICVDVAIVVGLAAWGFAVIYKSAEKQATEEKQN